MKNLIDESDSTRILTIDHMHQHHKNSKLYDV